jgi:hypothetical protein
MKRALSISFIVAIAWSGLCWPTIINIPADYPTIQQGIDASIDGDTVLVQPGTYVENINFNGHNIVLGSLFLTTGDTSYIAQTVIDGDSAGTVVAFENGEDSTTAIDLPPINRSSFRVSILYTDWTGEGGQDGSQAIIGGEHCPEAS